MELCYFILNSFFSPVCRVSHGLHCFQYSTCMWMLNFIYLFFASQVSKTIYLYCKLNLLCPISVAITSACWCVYNVLEIRLLLQPTPARFHIKLTIAVSIFPSSNWLFEAKVLRAKLICSNLHTWSFLLNIYWFWAAPDTVLYITWPSSVIILRFCTVLMASVTVILSWCWCSGNWVS